MKRLAILTLATLAACASKNSGTPDAGTPDAGPPDGGPKVPPPLPSITLPGGAQLKPYDATRPGAPAPYGLDQSGDKVYVALGNQRSDFSVAGPGFLAAVVPSTGATTLIDLGGNDEKQCQNPGFVRAAAGMIYVSCGGDFATGAGTAVVEVDPTNEAVKRLVKVPTSPVGVAIGPAELWFGDATGDRVYSIDRGTFAVDPAPVSLHCPSSGTYKTVSDVMVIGGDLFALCSNDAGGVLNRLDAATGAIKSDVKVGPIATELAATGDGRIAVVNAGDNTLTLVTLGTGDAMTATTALTFSGKNDALQDVRARSHFLYTVQSATNTAQKIDLNGTGGAKVVAEASFGAGANTWNIFPLDDDQAIVTNLLKGNLEATQWVAVH